MVDTLWTSDELASATNGEANTDFKVTGTVHLDSRKISSGDLFVAIEGPNNDGHKFVDQTLSAGAAGALVHKKSEQSSVKVDDTFKGLENLAHASVERSLAKRIAVTGSVGKTGTKELLAAGFASVGKTHATEGNLNNHFGLPLTLTRMPQNTDFAILELGMDHAGEISDLTSIAKPHVAIITKIAKVHMENFESIDQIASAKAEIFEGVVEGGTAIINRDDPFFDKLQAYANSRQLEVLSFGTHEEADARLLATQANKSGGQDIKARLLGNSLEFKLSLNGDHYGLSALAVLLAGKTLQQDVNAMAAGLEGVKPLAGRGQTTMLTNDILLIDESYNASPVAMKAAFGVLSHLASVRNGRKIAVLGDMLELGTESPQMHADLGESLIANGIDLVYCCGPLMNHLYEFGLENAGLKVEHFENSQVLSSEIYNLIRMGDTVLVKGSLGSAMAQICEALKEAFAV